VADALADAPSNAAAKAASTAELRQLMGYM
jgi:hypothetical protein